jgi:hypothetical protein
MAPAPLAPVAPERKARALADLGEASRAFLDEHGLDQDEFEATVAADGPAPDADAITDAAEENLAAEATTRRRRRGAVDA